MRILSIILTAIFCIAFIFSSATAAEEATPPHTFKVDVLAGGVTGGSISELSDSIGYGGGIEATVSKHIGIVGFYDYLPTGVIKDGGGKTYMSHVSAFGAVTLFDWRQIKFGGLVGLAWAPSTFADFLDDSPDLTVGLKGNAMLSKKVGLWAALTTPTDALDDFDNFKGRAGLSLTIF